MRTLTIGATDGVPLAVAVHMPDGPPRATVLLPAAMGARQSYYTPFAAWLAAHGYLAVTFDYRGIGDSAPSTLRGFDASMLDWAQRDYPAALRFAKSLAPDRPLYVIGHSLGGQLPGLLPEPELIDALVTVGSGNGYWRYNAAPTKRRVLLLWWVLVPLYTSLFGYFPGRQLRKVGDIPKAAMREWRR